MEFCRRGYSDSDKSSGNKLFEAEKFYCQSTGHGINGIWDAGCITSCFFHPVSFDRYSLEKIEK